ncbi:MAG: MFS transporter [Parachlamydiales bacterium]|nr:MFS transporter [Candidatus Acheromyda pituitae]
MPKAVSFFKTSFFILCFGAFLNWMSYGLVYPIFAASIFLHDSIFLGSASTAARGFWLGILLSACPLAQFFSSPFIGEMSDRKGRKPLLKLSTAIIVVGALLSVIGIRERSLYLLVLGRIFTGIGAGNITVINSSVADFSRPADKVKNLALIAMANGIGFAIGPFLGGKLSVFGFEIPFIFAGVLTLGNYLLICFFFSETLTHKKRSGAHLASRIYHLWRTTIADKFHVIFSAFFIFCFGWSYYWEFIPVTWIKSYSLNVAQIGNFYAFGSVIYVISSGLLIRFFVNRFKALPILFCALALLGASLLFLVDVKIEWYWFHVALQQFLIALIFPVGTAIVSDLTPMDQQGESLGVFQSLQAFGFAITPFLGGNIIRLSFDSPLVVGGIAMFLSCLVLLLGYRKKLLKWSKYQSKKRELV